MQQSFKDANIIAKSCNLDVKGCLKVDLLDNDNSYIKETIINGDNENGMPASMILEQLNYNNNVEISEAVECTFSA